MNDNSENNEQPVLKTEEDYIAFSSTVTKVLSKRLNEFNVFAMNKNSAHSDLRIGQIVPVFNEACVQYLQGVAGIDSQTLWALSKVNTFFRIKSGDFAVDSSDEVYLPNEQDIATANIDIELHCLAWHFDLKSIYLESEAETKKWQLERLEYIVD